MTELRGNRMTYLGVGITFLPLAMALWITMDNWALALPFVVLAVTFMVKGARSNRASEPQKDDVA